jgi:fructosamine-3-kinase
MKTLKKPQNKLEKSQTSSKKEIKETNILKNFSKTKNISQHFFRKQSKECLTKFQIEAKKSQSLQRENVAKAKEQRNSMVLESSFNQEEEDDQEERLLQQQRLQQEKNLQYEIQHNERILMEREQDIKEIEG